MAFEEFEAAAAAGLDLDRWERGLYSTQFKTQVLAWHRLHGMVETHVQDARNTKEEQMAKRARRGRKSWR